MSTFNYAGRLKALRQILKQRGADGAVIFSRVATQYLTGFEGSYSHLIVDDRTARLVVDGRYLEIAQGTVDTKLIRIVAQPVQGAKDFLKDLFKKSGYASVGYERSISVAQWESYKAMVGRAKWIPIEDALLAMRSVKDAEELARIRKAAKLADKMMEFAIGQLKPGAREDEVSRAIRRAAEDLGGEGESFENIVASGTNASRPHHSATTRRMKAGDMVTIDLGGRLGGYCSDLTRTPAISKVTKKFEEIYSVCLAANEAAIKAIRPGMTGGDADAVAREVIKSAGFGQYFSHSLGHGVGLEIHESPRLALESKDVLVPGNIITIEPGIYIPGFGGVRVEDLAVVTEKGVQVLSKAPKGLVAV